MKFNSKKVIEALCYVSVPYYGGRPILVLLNGSRVKTSCVVDTQYHDDCLYIETENTIYKVVSNLPWYNATNFSKAVVVNEEVIVEVAEGKTKAVVKICPLSVTVSNKTQQFAVVTERGIYLGDLVQGKLPVCDMAQTENEEENIELILLRARHKDDRRK